MTARIAALKLSRNGTEPRPGLSPAEQVVVAMVLTALWARLWRWW